LYKRGVFLPICKLSVASSEVLPVSHHLLDDIRESTF
jgi:hypothetical protein